MEQRTHTHHVMVAGHKIEIEWKDETKSFAFHIHFSSGSEAQLELPEPQQPQQNHLKRRLSDDNENKEEEDKDEKQPQNKKNKTNNNEKKEELKLNDLPNEIILHILGYMDEVMQLVCRSVCSLWRCLLLPKEGPIGLEPVSKFLIKVVSNRWLSLLKWAYDIRQFLQPELCEAAAEQGCLETLKWLNGKGCSCNKNNVCFKAVDNGHLHVLKWLDEKGYVKEEHTLLSRTTNQHQMDTLKWLLERRTSSLRIDLGITIVCNAARYGRLDIIKVIKSNKVYKLANLRHELVTSAIKGGHWNVIAWGMKHGCEWNSEIVDCAFSNGQVEIIKKAMKRVSVEKTDPKYCAIAARIGNLDMLKWLRKEEGFVWNEYVFSSAAEKSHIPILNWALKNGCPGEEIVLSAALLHKSLDAISWAVSKKCHWDGDMKMSRGGLVTRIALEVYLFLASKDRMDIVQWLKDHGGANWSPKEIDLCRTAAGEKQWKLLKWARQNGSRLDDAEIFNLAVGSGDMELLRWLKKERCPMQDKAFHHAESEEVINCLIELGCPYEKCYLPLMAAKKGFIEILKRKKPQSKDELRRMYIAAAGAGHLDILTLGLKDPNGLPVRECAVEAVRKEQIEVLRWLIEQKLMKPSPAIWAAVIRCGSIEFIEWLKQRGYPVPDTICTTAVKKGNRKLLLWAVLQGYPLSASLVKACWKHNAYAMLRIVMVHVDHKKLLLLPWIQ